MRRSLGSFLGAGALAGAAIGFWACGGGGGAKDGFTGLDGGGDASLGVDASSDGPIFGSDGGDAGGPGQTSCEAGCPLGLVCNDGVCDPKQAGCTSDSTCEDDTYCKNGVCVPYGADASNPGCQQSVPPGVFAPVILCEFTQAPTGDPFAAFLDVQATPIVVNFDTKAQGNSAIPSIVAPFTVDVPGSYTENRGILRILKGSDCSLVANLAGVDLDGDGVVDWVNSPSAVAVGDLNGDGVPEIVAYMGDFTTVAFTRVGSTWKPLWPKVKATTSTGAIFVDTTVGGPPNSNPGTTSLWASPSIHDLDNDGKPEIVREGYVIDGQTGVLRAALPAGYASYSIGIPPVLADLYGDGKIELTTGAHVWQFDGTTNAWNEVASYEGDSGAQAPGWVGLADFNPYDGKKAPEIVVAESSTMTIRSLDRSVFMNMSVAVPGGGGGPPTIADFDHDGLPEVGLAGGDYYTVFDPDCQATPRKGGKCASRNQCDSFPGGTCPDYILWSRATQDHSSDITGSSVFDFAGDGTPEVVYADECFARVYSGFDGTVLFSQYHSSCTWIENPVVADVTGTFHSEIVVPSNLACGSGTAGIACGQLTTPDGGVDTTFVGAACKVDGDCVSKKCDSGYCRCTTSAQCCSLNDDAKCIESGTECAAPPAGTPGTGDTCRAPHPNGVQGIRVYGDAKDRWVQSRQIWNQHAYAVTNVSPTGTIPASSKWLQNWTQTGLNNFRQNVPGEADGNPQGDLTAQAGVFYTCSGSSAVFEEPICNRGTAPVAAGVKVGFYDGTKLICTATTTSPLGIGQCAPVSCTWTSPPNTQGTEVNVSVIVDQGGGIPECDTKNDNGLVADVFCAGAQ